MNDPLEKPPIQAREVNAVYFNGFGIGFGNADISIQLMIDNVEFLTLKASYTTAKTLAQALTQTIDRFEKLTSHDLMTVEEIGRKMIEERKAKSS